MMKQNAQREKQKMISLEDFQDYHERVMIGFQNIIDMVKKEFGLDEEDCDFNLSLLGSNIAVRYISKNVFEMQNCAQNHFDRLLGNNVAFRHILKSQYLFRYMPGSNFRSRK